MQGYELTDFEWRVMAPLLPTKPRGVPRVDDRRVLNISMALTRKKPPGSLYGPLARRSDDQDPRACTRLAARVGADSRSGG